MEFFIYTLPNGVRCIHKRVRSAVAHCAVSINTGSRDENPDEHGIAHFVEHCMFKGTVKRSSYDIINYVEQTGGEVNAYTGKEETVVHATTLTEDVEAAVDIISDVVFNATFEPAKLRQERDVIIDEINSYQDSYPESIFDDFEDLLFGGSSLGHNILGTKKSLSKFSADDVRQFMTRTYTTDSMVFSLIGNVSREQFIVLCDKYFGSAKPTFRTHSREGVQGYRPFKTEMPKSEHQLHVILGNRAYGMNDRRRLAATIMANMLGGQNINSLLNIALREDNGLTYTVEAALNSYVDTGIFSIYFTTEKKKLEKCLALVGREMAKMKDLEFVQKMLPVAQKQFIGQFLISSESNENYMLSAVRSFIVFNKIDSMARVKRKIMAVKPVDIVEVANQLFADMSTLIYK